MSMMRQLRNCVLVDGARLPFQPSGTAYNKLVAYDLARLALTGILTKTGTGSMCFGARAQDFCTR